jgi:ubiquinone/menaquinone biosynthesis C-methylase UbiE
VPDKVLPYSKMAPFYDEIMEHVNYKLWAKYIKKLLACYRQRRGTIIDFSCGTGAIFKYLFMDKWQFIGSDRSKDMLEIAAEKFAEVKIQFLCSDFKNIPLKENCIEVALILYDSLNYLISDADVLPFFENIYKVLKPNGIFIFDVVTPYICKKAFSNYKEDKFWGNMGYARKAWYDQSSSIQYNEFTIKVDQTEYHELHQQKIRSQSEWTEYINTGPFQLMGAYNNFTLGKAHKRTERIHFVCRKSG